MGDHTSLEMLREYSLDNLPVASIAWVVEHLRKCSFCSERMAAIEPFNYIHFTEDGLIHSRATRLTTHRVLARHWGRDLEGGTAFSSASAAKRYLNESFAEMFPEHRCGNKCGRDRARWNRS